VAVSRAYPTHLAGYGKMKTGHPPILITWFLTKRFTRLRVFSIDLPLLALCQYRLCNISDHTISVFGIKTCIRRMSHIMLYEIHTNRYLNYLLNISDDFIHIIGSRSIWILGSRIVYWAGKEVVSRQGGRHLGLHCASIVFAIYRTIQ
jgi:hypothetical protein